MLVNYTIDDFQGHSDPYPLAYSPSSQWAFGPQCTTCNIYPGNLAYNGSGVAGAAVDVAQTFGGTWHDTTYHPGDPGYNVTASFVGQAVYVFNIIANDVDETTTTTDLVFTLDGVVVGQYTHIPDPSGPKLMYQVPVYINSSMPHANHTLTMSAGEAETSLILFDYIIFTADEPAAYQPVITADDGPLPPTTTPTPPLARSDAPMISPTLSASSSSTAYPRSADPRSPAFIGSIVGGSLLGALVVIALVAICFRTQQKHRLHARTLDVSVFLTETTFKTPPSPARPLLPSPPYFAPASDGFSTVAIPPASRFAQSSSSAASTAPLPDTGSHAARVRLFEKISATSHFARTRVSADRDGPCTTEEPSRIIPRDAVARRLLAEAVALRAQAAEFLYRDPQVVACGLAAGPAPPYEHRGRTT